MSSRFTRSICFGLLVAIPAPLAAQRSTSSSPAATSTPTATTVSSIDVPRDYVIGVDDVLEVMFWKDKDLSRDVVVRPDGKIALQLLNEVQAAGLTPEQLRDVLLTEAKRFIEDPSVAVNVKQINSRKVFITGMVEKPGMYPLTSSMSVLQLISIAGGLKEFAKKKDIVVMRHDRGAQLAYPFNYADILKGKRLAQNMILRPGDTVVVP
jgi:polysaccharide export outer membrane protein